ncbi:hypothetical protein CU309_07620 [Prochlorococcus marinus str. MU1405]|nr:hypothetical protein [Prochlorococcus marinus str. MU1405]MBW3048168.1 hypothetical protein [Prochlorococcus marinus str. MU1406]
MLINRLIKMYGLRHKYIRIEDQQPDLKINIIMRTFYEERKYFRYSYKTNFTGKLVLQETFEDDVSL